MAEEKPQETPSVGLPSGGAVDQGPGMGVYANTCWHCGQDVGDTYLAITIRCYTPRPEPLLAAKLHHACHRDITLVMKGKPK
jgi:hypothetical protein